MTVEALIVIILVIQTIMIGGLARIFAKALDEIISKLK